MIKNIIALRTFNPFKKMYAYVDTNNYLADRIFLEKRLNVKFLKDFYRHEDDYIIVFVKVKNKDVPEFMECIKELEKRLLITGHDDFSKIIDDTTRNLIPIKRRK